MASISDPGPCGSAATRRLAWCGVGLAVFLALPACAPVGPNYVRPEAILSPQYKEIAGWKLASPRDSEPKGDWWTLFHDPTLDRLEPEVEVTSQTVIAAEANYRQALALISEARAALFPTLAVSPSVSRDSSLTTQFNALGSLNWTLDIWGQVRREIEAQTASAEQKAADLANARLAAQTAIAIAYIQLRSADVAHEMYSRTTAEFKKTLDITREQYQGGAASSSDVDTAEVNLLSAQADDVDAGVARAKSEHAIAVLIGVPPAALSIPPRNLLPSAPTPSVALPATLLERRPDVASAERAMAQANAEIGVAFAGYFPNVTLSAGGGFVNATGGAQSFETQGNVIQQLSGASTVWNVALALSQTIFDAGLTDARLAAARAAYDASVADYRQTVLGALQSVEDQLAAIRLLIREDALRAEAVEASKRALDKSFAQFQAGAQPYTVMSNAQTTWLTQQQLEIVARTARLQALVNLVTALGGGWDRSQLEKGLPASPS